MAAWPRLLCSLCWAFLAARCAIQCEEARERMKERPGCPPGRSIVLQDPQADLGWVELLVRSFGEERCSHF
jgi:hypothetical protein